jgi:hypothetical protein
MPGINQTLFAKLPDQVATAVPALMLSASPIKELAG